MRLNTNLQQDCLLCHEVISNQVCHSCMESEIEDWLSDRMPKLVMKLKKTGQVFKSYTQPGVNCVLCSSNVNVCTQCYCNEVNKLFGNYPRLEEEFTDFFNFELGGSKSSDLEV